MQKLFLFFSISILLNSCSSTKSNEEKITQEQKIEYPEQLASFLKHFPLEKFDYKVDLSFLNDSVKNHTKSVLSLKEVKLLNSQTLKVNSSETSSYYLNDYYSIEQAKLNKKYDEYVQKLDIGMMRDVNCYALSRLEFGDSVALLIWKLNFSSYEACPYYTGTHLLGTIISEGKIIETMQIANQETSADAPMSAVSTQFLSIKKTGTISCNFETIVMEEGEESEIEHSTEKKEYQITKNGFKLILSKK